MIFVTYLLLVVLVVYLSARLGHYVDLLDRKTTMASAFIGGVLLAAVTSLPELMTSITSIAIVGKPQLVIGNILGSNLFNIAVLGLVFLLFFKKLCSANISSSHKSTALSVTAVYIVLCIVRLTGNSLFFYGISFVSIIILALYITCIRSMSNDDNDTEEAVDVSPLTLRQVIIRFVLFSIALVCSSIAITIASDIVGTKLNLGATLAGALLLGIATSLPELISCFVLAKIGNFNAMTGNIIGSNIFNFAILFVADVVSWNKELYKFDAQGTLLVFLGMASVLAMTSAIMILTAKKSNTLQGGAKSGIAILNLAPILFYIAFVALS